MMSATILITTVTPPTSGHSASLDQTVPEGMSFAKSLGERLGDPPLLQGNNSPEEAAVVPRSSKSTEVVSRPNETAEQSPDVKRSTVAGQVIPAGNELKSTVTTKIVEPQTIAVAGAKGKTTTSAVETAQTEPPVQGEEIADNTSTSFVASEPILATSSIVSPLALRASIADGKEPLVGGGDGVAVPQKRASVEKTVEHASVKTSPKTQESVATSKVAPKALGTTEGTPAIDAKPATLAEGSVSLGGQGIGAVVVAQPNEIGKTTGAAGEAAPGAKPVIGTAAATVSESARKEEALAAKPAAIDAEAPLPAAGGTVAPAKPGTGVEKSAEAAIPANANGDGKTQSLAESTVATVHAGDLPGNETVTKLPVVDATPHAAGLQPEERELHSPDVLSAALDAPRVLTAIPTALEVGIQSGTHGWLKVRAEIADGGVVNASVSAVSTAGQEMLRRELPALTSYLQEEKVVVNALVVHSAAGAEPRGSTTGMDSGGGPTQQRSNEGGEQRQYDGNTVSDGSDEVVSYQGVSEEGLTDPAMYERGGNWLSVRA